MTIRPIERQDLKAFISLMTAFAEFDGTEHSINLDIDRANEAFFSANPKLFSLVVDVDGEIVGFLNYCLSYSSFSLQPCMWIEDVFLLDAYRSKGIGGKLFLRVREIATKLRCKEMEWLVRRTNKSGIQFYNKIGAKVDEGTIYVSWPI